MRVPRFKLETAEDAYAYYVLILGVPESLFWDADIPFLLTVAADKAAYDSWVNAETAHQREGGR